MNSRGMEVEPYIELDWNAPFNPLYGSPITLPPHVILWRGHDTAFPAISSRPAYYSSQEIASTYVRATHKLTSFMTTRPLQLLDYRFLRNLLQRLIQTNREDKYSAELAPLMLSFGLCSLEHQLKIMAMRYRDVLQNQVTGKVIRDGMAEMQKTLQSNALLEQIGVRVAETTNDGGTMVFLKELFKGSFDGFISPSIQTAFHTDHKLHPELILFDPVSANIVELPDIKPRKFRGKILKGQIYVPIEQFIKDTHILYEVRHPSNVKMSWYMGGAKSAPGSHRLDEYDKMVVENKIVAKEDRRQQKAGARWRRKMMIVNTTERVPHVNVSPFIAGPMEEITVQHKYESGL